jgi:glycine/D-amino acid oxidase-like deaminating enzyme
VTRPRVAVLGAGVLGSSAAILLARRGADVTVFDQAPAPMAAASRWNEGKIHLGFMYAADPSLETARRVIPGGLAFPALMRELIGGDLAPATTRTDDVYLCERRSVVDPQSLEAYLRAVGDLVARSAPPESYFPGVRGFEVERLTARELESIASPDHVVAGFRVPERSVDTNWVADRLAAAVLAEAQVLPVLSTRVDGVRAESSGSRDTWTVETPGQSWPGFDTVVNALWQGRIPIDRQVGVPLPQEWSDRYRLSLFVRTARPVNLVSAVLAVGPFGDVKNYDGRTVYLSWYPAGLVAQHTGSDPVEPTLEGAVLGRVRDEVISELGARLHGLGDLAEQLASARVEGGWVHAAGTGSLADRAATLHRRADFGVRRRGSYYSVDTGKYSTAPWLAGQLTDQIVGRH